MLFDNFSDMLINGAGTGHTTVDTDAFGNFTGTHTRIGNNVFHYNTQGLGAGHDSLLNGQVNHHDVSGQFTGTSQGFGNGLLHKNAAGLVTGHDVRVGGDSLHYDQAGRYLGKTTATGQEFDSMNRLVSNFRKIF